MGIPFAIASAALWELVSAEIASMFDGGGDRLPVGVEVTRGDPRGARGCGWARFPLPADGVGALAPELREALDRVNLLLDMAQGCAVDPLARAELDAIGRAARDRLFVGTEARGDLLWCEDVSARPTMVQVRAWLDELAGVVGKMCADAELGGLRSEIKQALDHRAAAPDRVIGLSPAGLALGLGAVALAWAVMR